MVTKMQVDDFVNNVLSKFRKNGKTELSYNAAQVLIDEYNNNTENKCDSYFNFINKKHKTIK